MWHRLHLRLAHHADGGEGAMRYSLLVAILAALLSGCPLIEDTRVPDAGRDARVDTRP